MKNYSNEIKRIIFDLNSDIKNGLTNDKIEKSKIINGKNIFLKKKDKNFFEKILKILMEPMIFVLIISLFLSNY